MARHAVLYYAHYDSEAVRRELNRIRGEVEDFEIFCLGCCSAKDALSDIIVDSVTPVAYTRDELRQLPYPNRVAVTDWTTMRCSNDLAIMLFFREHPDFDFYWVIEYDVRFSGSWGALLGELALSPADLLATHITPYSYFADWIHWKSMMFGADDFALVDCVRAFLPFCRLSKRLLASIDEVCQTGWSGHYEGLWATVASIKSLAIEEIGGESDFVPPNRKSLFYQSAFKNGVFLSTFTAWPFFSDKSRFGATSSPKNTLWHPVKDQ